jgi:6-phosphogluconate dehydrogenase
MNIKTTGATALARPGSVIDGRYPKVTNDTGTPEISLGCREFECVGVSQPHDHPHIYLAMGEDEAILCPYRATQFRFNPRLGAGETDPPGIHYVDVGTSGGVWGSKRGYSLMIGGEDAIICRLGPIFVALAPSTEDAPCIPGRKDVGGGTAEQGYLHCGPSGAGRFVKMVHNGIEYGIMRAYAEGLNILRHANAGKQRRTADGETALLRHPENDPYDPNLADIAEVRRRGSVIAAWLLDLAAAALLKNPDLGNFAAPVSDSGEGRWPIAAAIDESVHAPGFNAALYQRFSSRDGEDVAHKVLSALHFELGGDEEEGTAKNGDAS